MLLKLLSPMARIMKSMKFCEKWAWWSISSQQLSLLQKPSTRWSSAHSSEILKIWPWPIKASQVVGEMCGWSIQPYNTWTRTLLSVVVTLSFGMAQQINSKLTSDRKELQYRNSSTSTGSVPKSKNSVDSFDWADNFNESKLTFHFFCD